MSVPNLSLRKSALCEHVEKPVQADSQETACCGSATCGDTAPPSQPLSGRSFQVNGLDCAEEVAILNRVVGPEVGGEAHLAFDVINGRMTVLDSARTVSDDAIIKAVAGTGMRAQVWDAGRAEVDRAAHLGSQRFFTAASGGFWAAGFL